MKNNVYVVLSKLSKEDYELVNDFIANKDYVIDTLNNVIEKVKEDLDETIIERNTLKTELALTEKENNSLKNKLKYKSDNQRIALHQLNKAHYELNMEYLKLKEELEKVKSKKRWKLI